MASQLVRGVPVWFATLFSALLAHFGVSQVAQLALAQHSWKTTRRISRRKKKTDPTA